MYHGIAYFSFPQQPTASHFAKPICSTAHYFCRLANKDVLSYIDLFFIQDSGFKIKILTKEDAGC